MKKYLKGFIKYFFYKKVSFFTLITEDSEISKKAKINRNILIYKSKINDYSYIGSGTQLYYASVGKFCSIAGDCNIGLANHSLNFLSTSPIFTEKNNGTGFSWVKKDFIDHSDAKVQIGNDVWIGHRVMILGNVNVGNGAIIGAGSVVTKDVPDFAIFAGVPAKLIRYRFDEEIRSKISKQAWWDKSEKEIKENLIVFQKDNLTQNDIEIFENSVKI